jgi:hypothetical protein
MDASTSLRTWAAGTHALDLGSRRWAVAIWALGLAAAAIGFFWEAGRAPLWLLAFGTSGALCTLNGIRSRRFHCLFTGPIFLTGATLVGLRWAGHLGSWSWNGIGLGVLGAVAAAVLLELGVKGSGRCS